MHVATSFFIFWPANAFYLFDMFCVFYYLRVCVPVVGARGRRKQGRDSSYLSKFFSFFFFFLFFLNPGVGRNNYSLHVAFTARLILFEFLPSLFINPPPHPHSPPPTPSIQPSSTKWNMDNEPDCGLMAYAFTSSDVCAFWGIEYQETINLWVCLAYFML